METIRYGVAGHFFEELAIVNCRHMEREARNELIESYKAEVDPRSVEEINESAWTQMNQLFGGGGDSRNG